MSEPVRLTLEIYALAVVISLALAALVRLMGLALRRSRPRRSAPPPAAASARAEAVPGEHVAAIAAVLAEVLGAHRIVHIGERSHGDGWAHEGRYQHHHSHDLPRAPRR